MSDKPRMRSAMLAGALVAAGCAGRDTEAPVAPVRVAPSGPTVLPSSPVEPAARPRLRKPGAEPRRVLRYRPTVGAKHELELAMAARMLMTSSGERMYNRDDNSRSRIALRVASVDGGAITIDVEVVEAHEPTFDPIRAGKVQLDGMKGWFTVDDRGVLIRSSASLESAAARDYLYLLDYMHPLPDEPIGIGAEWELEQLAPRSGITMTTLQKFRLTALDGDRVTMAITDEEVAPPQLVPAFAYDAISLFENLALTGGGSTDTEVTLDVPLPRRIESRFSFSNDMFIHRPFREPQPVTLTMSGTLRATLR